MGLFGKIGKGFKKIGNGTKGFFTKTIGGASPDKIISTVSKVPVLGGLFGAAGEAGKKIGEGFRDKNAGHALSGLVDAGKTFAQIPGVVEGIVPGKK